MAEFFNVEKQNGICVDDHLTYDEAFERARELSGGDRPMYIRQFEVDRKGVEKDCGVITIV